MFTDGVKILYICKKETAVVVARVIFILGFSPCGGY